MNANRKAFLDMIGESEGAKYNTIVGGSTFDDYSTHPKKRIWLQNLGVHSTAAGRYQINQRTWGDCCKMTGLNDFSPETQDLMAIALIKRRHALDDVDAGRFDDAVHKCCKEWASFPEAGYGQHENTLVKLRLAYAQHGGGFA